MSNTQISGTSAVVTGKVILCLVIMLSVSKSQIGRVKSNVYFPMPIVP